MLDKNKPMGAILSIVGALIIIYLFFKFALWGILPILLGWLISLFICPLGDKLARKIRAPKRLVVGVLVILFFLSLFGVLWLALRRLIMELSSFAARIEAHPEIIENALSSISGSFSKFKLFERLSGVIDSLGEYAYIADEIINNILDSAMSAVGGFLSGAAKSLVLGIPTALLFVVTLITSAFYFSVDRDKIYGLFKSIIPEKARRYISRFTEGGARAAAGYIKSSLILMLITFVEMLIFLWLLRVEYSLIISIVIAVVDVLPLLGVGAVLVPWSIYSFLTANVKMGVWLLVIFIVATVLRNVLEPRILGKRVGVHPFIIIASAYLGFTLLGGVGLLAGPLVCAAFFAMRNGNAPAVKWQKPRRE